MSTELMALGNRRPALRAEISEGTERIRKAQFEALTAKYGDCSVPRRQIPFGGYGAVTHGHPEVPQP